MVVNGDVNAFPADPSHASFSVTVNPVSNTANTAEPLDIQVEQVSRRIMFIPLHRRWWVNRLKIVQSTTSQHSVDGRFADPRLAGDLPSSKPLTP